METGVRLQNYMYAVQVLERMRQVKAEQEKDNRSAEIRIGIYKERIKGLRSAKKAAIQPDGKAAA
ncbi:hypothetical protein BD626DRAFT_576174 [Schizophyllum amplum]|uniref:Uncharacterized protein n=1 Tax=Schizophyllum amplum TaxID=97359 RepID=A0A550BU16_9AGAR|nr:hypothetical protein BD626DRAFT_576174 [Auriculariopsis ampla]